MKNPFFTVILFCSLSQLIAQSPADWWYFGNQAGVHFETGGPVADPNGALITSEGCASISDAGGNLLFYTDGISVFDATHTLMPNGTGLLGNSSSTQSAIVIPRPQSTTQFYIFTVDDGGGIDGLKYTTVDMTLNSGLGDVIAAEKNISLVSNTAEKVAALKKTNGFWIVTLKMGTDTAYAYEVTSSGVNLTPVTSTTGVNLGGNFWGYLKGNVQSTKMGFISQGINEAYVFDFDLNTGAVTGSVAITQTIGGSTGYGIEFSPNGNLLYTMSYGSCDVKQYDLTLGTSAAISASEVILGNSESGGGALQIGPDSKMYICRGGKSYLSAIEFPNVYGSGANFIDAAVNLSTGKICNLGLPTFVQSFFNVAFNANNTCLGDSSFFTVDTTGVDSVIWNFGDPASGTNNTSSDFFAFHVFSDTGAFTVTLIAYSDTLIDTAFQELVVYPNQTIDLGPDTMVCRGTVLEFFATQPFSQFLWHDSTTADTFLTANDTFVKVTVFGVCDTVVDSVFISYDDSIFIDIGPDTLLCGGQAYIINSSINTSADLAWSTGDSISTSISVNESDDYFLMASNACGIVTDSVEVIFRPVPGLILLPPDTINCFENEIVLEHPNLDSTTYIWSDSSTKKTYRVDTTETVWLAAFNECGSSIDTIKIIFNGEIISELGEDTTICNLDSIVLDASSPGASYVWNTNDTTDSIVTDMESKLYVVTVTQGLCTTIESKRVDLSDVFCPSIDCRVQVSNVITPNGDGMNDKWKVQSDCKIREFDLHIFNRWGQLVFASDNVNISWDGTVNGEPASDGIYFYEMEFKDTVIVDVDNEDFRGSITLIRD
jgi:gliding motility-associated-like protein